MVEARNGAGPIKSYPRPGSRLKMQNGSKGSGLQNKTFHCEICDVHVNSEIQLKQVMYPELVVSVAWGHPLTMYLLIYIMVLTLLTVKFPNFIGCLWYTTYRCYVEEKVPNICAPTITICHTLGLVLETNEHSSHLELTAEQELLR